MDSTVPPRPTGGSRSPAQIESDLEQTRERLATNIDQLAARMHPKAVAKRSTDKAKSKAAETLDQAKVVALDAVGKGRALAVQYTAQAKVIGRDSVQRAKGELVDPSGAPRPDRVAAVGAAAAAVVGLLVWRRRR